MGADTGMTDRQIEKELERQKVLFEEKCKTGRAISCSIRFADFAEIWFTDYAQEHLRPKTLSRYKKLMGRINAEIGHIRLDKLAPNHLNAFYKNLAEPGCREDTKYRCKADFTAHLKQACMTKKTLGEIAGVSITVLNSVTQGKNISASSTQKICSALSVKLPTLFAPSNAGETLSGKTLLHHHRLISSILQSAVMWQVIAENPCERVVSPKVPKTDPQIFG